MDTFDDSPLGPTWLEWHQLGSCTDDVIALCRLAAAALWKEDQELAQLRLMPEGAAAGLTYWLFETTLVYLIFKAWATAGHRVRWDYERPNGMVLSGAAKPGLDEEDRRCLGPLDLVVDLADERGRYAFEAKWWNQKITGLFDHDAKKLVGWQSNARENGYHGATGYHIAFWWADAGKLTEDIKEAFKAVGSRYVYRSRWRTKAPGEKEQRWFVMEVFCP